MANEITFKFKSDAPWNEEELNGLLDAFVDEAKNCDDDFVIGSSSITCIPEGEENDKAVRDAAIELITNGKLSVEVILKDENDVPLYENSFDADADV